MRSDANIFIKKSTRIMMEFYIVHILINNYNTYFSNPNSSLKILGERRDRGGEERRKKMGRVRGYQKEGIERSNNAHNILLMTFHNDT